MRRAAFIAMAALLLGALAPGLRAFAPPNPGESVLVIYDDATAYDQTLAAQIITWLSSPAMTPGATVTPLVVHAASVGIYNDLTTTTGQTSLSNWCQVWDLRFREDKDNIAYTGPNQCDVITFQGPNNDTLLYTNYLNQNGHLFLQGEHHDFYIRDLNLFALINAVATVPLNPLQVYADYNPMNTGAIPAPGGFPAAPASFNLNFNDISCGTCTINAGFPGGLEVNYAGSGQPIGAYFAGSDYSAGGMCNTAYAWMSNDLKTNGGRMVVSFETNAFQDPQPAATPASVAEQWIQNVYTLLSGCYKYSLNKTFLAQKTPVCVGSSSAFTLCSTNNGSTPLTNVDLWDTIPTCLTYNSDSQGGPTVTGNVYNWVVPLINPGNTYCITVNFTVNSFP